MIVFDIDGVLADTRHRAHHICKEDLTLKEHPDWEAFFAECGEDPVIESGMVLLRALAEQGHNAAISFLTGRSEQVRTLTEDWLEENLEVWYDELIMRPVGDHRPDYVFKGEQLRRLQAEGSQVELLVDDSLPVIEAALKLGITCLHFRRPEWPVDASHPGKAEVAT